MRKKNAWKLWVDTGGTFTDCVAVDPDGVYHRRKLLSSGALRGSIVDILNPTKVKINAAWQAPADFVRGFTLNILGVDHGEIKVVRYDPGDGTLLTDRPLPEKAKAGHHFEVTGNEEAAILAARLVLNAPPGEPLPDIEMRLGTTRGTNTLLERRGARVAVFVTQGFRDLLAIGDQTRPDLFALDIVKPKPLYDTVSEVTERLDASGDVIVPLNLEALAVHADRLVKQGIRDAAVALLHSDINSDHECRLEAFLMERGFDHVSVSSSLAPFVKVLPRAETCVVNAVLAREVDDYLGRIETSVAGGSLHVMTSAGGLARRESYHAKDSLLSGPAGGVVGAALAGKRAGFEKLITFDMGGTSTDVARFDGDYDYVFEHRVGDAHLVAPAVAIESVAAGGGSVCRYHRSELTVGPASAGASPGPACYGAGGPLTLTDVNLLLGRIDPDRFGIPIDIKAAKESFDKLRRATATDKKDEHRLLEGLRDIANETMADAIRSISIRKGYGVADHALVAFGGAGGQHGCGVAERLGIDTVVIPRDASLLSALGLGNAVIERFAERQILQTFDDDHEELGSWVRELGNEARTALEDEGVAPDDCEIRRFIVGMRFVGQDTALDIDYNEGKSLRDLFETSYREVYGYWPPGQQIEIVSIRAIASELTRPADNDEQTAVGIQSATTKSAWFDGEWQTVPVIHRNTLDASTKINGPALIVEPYTVTVVDSGWTATVDGALILRKSTAVEAISTQSEVVRLELFTHRFENIAREMGDMLQRTSLSTNVKERMDFSCAVLDNDGRLVANAPHIPVHLGAIGMCVREMCKTIEMKAGDIVVTNHPRFGGSHLPDLTVVMPVHTQEGVLVGYVANRAHHAEIGGVQPGSMPVNATHLGEEGVAIAPTYLYREGEACWEDVRELLVTGPYPTRNVEDNLADLRAAVAAVRSGAAALLELVDAHTRDEVLHYMYLLSDRAASRVQDALSRFPTGAYKARELLDDGSPLRVSLHNDGESITIDFAGSAGVHPGNLNTTPAVVNSVVVYFIRTLIADPLPLNEGLLKPVKLIIPPGILNPVFTDDPMTSPAVFGGNVETSQRLVDTLFKAFDEMACSQGTMNNIVFGTERFSYFETVCGGAGATSVADGANAVHTHMTNTRITDPEILERRYPVRLERFETRSASGGAGLHPGGEGVTREITFLEPMTLSLLGQHRSSGPYGVKGGKEGKRGEQTIVRSGGEIVELNSADTCEVAPGDRLILKTPGGGGWGEPLRDKERFVPRTNRLD